MRKTARRILAAALLAGSLSWGTMTAEAATGAELVEEGKAAYTAADYNKAYTCYNEALTQDSSLAEAYAGRCRALCRLGKPQEALVDINRALEMEPENGLFYAYRSQAYADMGDRVRQVEELQKAVAILPDELVVNVNLMCFLSELGSSDEALPYAEVLLKMFETRQYQCRLLNEFTEENWAYTLVSIASTFINCSQPDYERALALCDKSLTMNYQIPFAYYIRTQVLHKLGRYEEALADCRTFIDQAVKAGMMDWIPMMNLQQSSIYFDMKDYEKALYYSDLILKTQEGWKDNHLLRHEIYKAMGDKANAEASAKRYLELGGDPKEVK